MYWSRIKEKILLRFSKIYRLEAKVKELKTIIADLSEVVDRDLNPRHADYLEKFIKREEGIVKDFNGAILYGRAERKRITL